MRQQEDEDKTSEPAMKQVVQGGNNMEDFWNKQPEYQSECQVYWPFEKKKKTEEVKEKGSQKSDQIQRKGPTKERPNSKTAILLMECILHLKYWKFVLN